ncbi:MAG TPA: hypothetical protein VIT90_14400 [Lysobacter sp.]
MNRTINRFGGRTNGCDISNPRRASDNAYTVIGRRCSRCRQSKAITGGRARWVFRNNTRVSEFTCAGCIA